MWRNPKNDPPRVRKGMGGTYHYRVFEKRLARNHIANLFVAGPGLFPTGGGVNPTFTLHAVTLQLANHVINNWSGLT